MIAIFLLYTLPVSSGANAAPTVNVPTVGDMPPANTSTNMLTSGINKALNTAANAFDTTTKRNNTILNNIGNYMPNFGGNTNRTKGLNFPFSQV